MSTYFKLKCFEPETTQKIIIVSNIIIAVLGVVHWGYCGVISNFLRLYYNFTQKPGNFILLTSYDSYKKLMDSPMAYYAITGIQQVLSSVLVVVIAHTNLGMTSKRLWRRLIAVTILFNFAFNFVIAVSSSMTATYYNQLFKDQLDQLNSLGQGVLDDWIVELIKMIRFIMAEAVLTFVISLPLIALTMVAFAENTFKDDFEIATQVSNENTLSQIKVQQAAVK